MTSSSVAATEHPHLDFPPPERKSEVGIHLGRRPRPGPRSGRDAIDGWRRK